MAWQHFMDSSDTWRVERLAGDQRRLALGRPNHPPALELTIFA